MDIIINKIDRKRIARRISLAVGCLVCYATSVYANNSLNSEAPAANFAPAPKIIVATNSAVPDGKITLVMASTDANQDKVPFTLKLSDGDNISLAQITITPATSQDGQIAEINHDYCVLKPAVGLISCNNAALPLESGVANYIMRGSWISTSGRRGNFESTPLTFAVDMLYAGYTDDIVYHKGKTYHLPGESYGVTGLAFDKTNHTFYALDGHHVFKQDLTAAESEFTPFIQLNKALGYSLSLTNNSQIIMVGDENGGLNFFNKNNGSLSNTVPTSAPVNSISFNPLVDNNMWITNQATQIYRSFVNEQTSKGQVMDIGKLPDEVSNVQVIAAQDGIFASGDSGCDNCGSFVYIWESAAASFNKVITDNPSPFTGKTLITTMFTPEDGRGLYIGGNNGTLYQLAYTAASPQMHWTALNSGQPIAKDAVAGGIIDDNGNIYLTLTNAGVWKIPADGSPAFKVAGFDRKDAVANVLAIARSYIPPLNNEVLYVSGNLGIDILTVPQDHPESLSLLKSYPSGQYPQLLSQTKGIAIDYPNKRIYYLNSNLSTDGNNIHYCNLQADGYSIDMASCQGQNIDLIKYGYAITLHQGHAYLTAYKDNTPNYPHRAFVCNIANDGSLNNCTPSDNGLPDTSSDGSAGYSQIEFYKDHAYVAGSGGNGGSYTTRFIYKAEIKTDGSLSDWVLAANGDMVGITSLAFYNNYLYTYSWAPAIIAAFSINNEDNPVRQAILYNTHVPSSGTAGLAIDKSGNLFTPIDKTMVYCKLNQSGGGACQPVSGFNPGEYSYQIAFGMSRNSSDN